MNEERERFKLKSLYDQKCSEVEDLMNEIQRLKAKCNELGLGLEKNQEK